jgi:hypothetical protein
VLGILEMGFWNYFLISALGVAGYRQEPLAPSFLAFFNGRNAGPRRLSDQLSHSRNLGTDTGGAWD